MRTSISARFENGVFKPFASPHIAEGSTVTLVLEQPDMRPADILSLASKVFEGLTPHQIQQVDSVVRDRSRFFEGRVQ